MEFIYIIITLVILYVVFKKLNILKHKVYPEGSFKILVNNFTQKDFSLISTEELKKQLEIDLLTKSLKAKSAKSIIDEAKRKSDIIYNHRMKLNHPYNDLTTFKVIANCTIEYCIKKNINTKDSIKVLFLTLQDIYLQETLDITKDEKEIINYFYILLDGFIKRYDKKLSENS